MKTKLLLITYIFSAFIQTNVYANPQVKPNVIECPITYISCANSGCKISNLKDRTGEFNLIGGGGTMKGEYGLNDAYIHYNNNREHYTAHCIYTHVGEVTGNYIDVGKMGKTKDDDAIAPYVDEESKWSVAPPVFADTDGYVAYWYQTSLEYNNIKFYHPNY